MPFSPTDDDFDARYEAAGAVCETMRVLEKSGSNLVAEILRTEEEFVEWEHIPSDDVRDSANCSQYFYHAHPKSDDGRGPHDDEHGHFHLFLRDEATGEDDEDTITHLIGIGMNADGAPIRLFTVNRWVTGDTWVPAKDLIHRLDQFEIDDTRPSWALNLWITNIVRLYRPEIIELLNQRDDTVERWVPSDPAIDVFEDHSLEVTSALEIDLAATVGQLEQALDTR